jgi:hypothetical protein
VPKQRPPWFVRRDPAFVRYSFFISHVGEDSKDVKQLKAEIEAYSSRGGRPPLSSFLDVQNWPGGNENSEVIRDYLLQSGHVVAWISPDYLKNDRGWIWMELAYAELIELSINIDYLDMHEPFVIPVFRDVRVELVQRTPWLRYWQRQLTTPNQECSVEEIAHKLVDFHEQELRKRV